MQVLWCCDDFNLDKFKFEILDQLFVMPFVISI